VIGGNRSKGHDKSRDEVGRSPSALIDLALGAGCGSQKNQSLKMSLPSAPELSIESAAPITTAHSQIIKSRSRREFGWSTTVNVGALLGIGLAETSGKSLKLILVAWQNVVPRHGSK